MRFQGSQNLMESLLNPNHTGSWGSQENILPPTLSCSSGLWCAFSPGYQSRITVFRVTCGRSHFPCSLDILPLFIKQRDLSWTGDQYLGQGPYFVPHHEPSNVTWKTKSSFISNHSTAILANPLPCKLALEGPTHTVLIEPLLCARHYSRHRPPPVCYQAGPLPAACVHPLM